MTTFLLIRHGKTDAIDQRIVGRMPGIHLNADGIAEAEDLAHRLSLLHVDAIYSSPLERAQETALPLAKKTGLNVRTSGGLLEVDFGEWTGLTFSELSERPAWKRFNRFRSSTAPPGGELMASVQARAVAELERLRGMHPSQTLALFSHGDVIKLLIAHYLGIPHDLFQRLLIDPASVSVLVVEERWAQVRCINITAAVSS